MGAVTEAVMEEVTEEVMEEVMEADMAMITIIMIITITESAEAMGKFKSVAAFPEKFDKCKILAISSICVVDQNVFMGNF